jgi:hypothetical protein
MQSINIRNEFQGVLNILSAVHNLRKDNNEFEREFSFEIQEGVEMVMRAMPSILPSILFTMVNQAYIENHATKTHVVFEQKGDQIVLTLNTNMESKQIYPNFLTENILALLIIFSAKWKVHPTEVGHEADGSTISFFFPAVTNALNN